jgi:pimeloyl-ACP methyl ester carboxylesterase
MKTRIIQDEPDPEDEAARTTPKPTGPAQSPGASSARRTPPTSEPRRDHVKSVSPTRRYRRDSLGLLATAVALLASALPAVATAAPSRSAPIPRLSWQDCGDGFECATARVPLDYDRPDGRSIHLALIRLPATDPAHRIGSLFINPGGPGNSGVQFVREAARTDYPAGVRARFDIVGVDPRGVAGSTPVRCFANDAQREQFFADYNVLPIGQSELRAQVAKDADLAARCQARVGWLLPHLSTANVARDLDLLRQAVGDDELNYVGYSYGTYLGATYANLFPDKVRTLALDGNTIPSAYPDGPRRSVPFVRVHAHLAASETLDQFFDLCAQAGLQCPFADGAHPSIKFAVLAARLRAHPLALPDRSVIGYAELVDFTLQQLYRASDWLFAADTLQQLYVATTPGNRLTHNVATPAVTTPHPNTQEALFGSVCTDTHNPSRASTYAAVAARADRRAPYVGSFWTYLSLPCVVWAAHDHDRYSGPWHVRTARPALVLNNRWDPATGFRNAVRMTHLLTGSGLVIVEGWGHTVRDTHSDCADQILERYLVEGQLPAYGTTCAPGIVPFASTP